MFAVAADVRGDILRVYLAVATAIAGGTLGIYGSRSMDRRDDRRKLRRKANVARMKIRALRFRIEAYQQDLEKATTSPVNHMRGVDTHFGTWELHMILINAANIYRAATATPDFDDLLDTEEDFIFADFVSKVFDHLADMFDRYKTIPDDDSNCQVNANVLVDSYDEASYKQQVKILQAAEDHFAQRTQGI